MNQEHRYAPARPVTETPPELMRYLDGSDLLAKTQAVRLSTVDETGWPRAALLSAGDMLALTGGLIRFLMFKDSSTAKTLLRDPRLTLTLGLDGGMFELLTRARPLSSAAAEAHMAAFEAKLEGARFHKAPYADVATGVTFALHDPQSALERWRRQIEALRAAK